MIIEAGNKVRNTGPSLYKFECELVSQNILVPYNQNLRSQLSCPLYTYPSQCLCLFMSATGQLDTTGRDFHYPRSLNISLHFIISDFARRRQSLKSKCCQIITNQGVCKQINTKHRPDLPYFSRVVLSCEM